MLEPKVEIIFNDSKAEAEYLCYLAKDISLKRYQNGGFLILPYLASNNLASVHFPDLPYSKNFWKPIKKCKNEDYGQEFPQEAINEIIKCLGYQHYSKTEISKADNLISDWQKYKKAFFDFINNQFDQKSKLDKIKNVSVLITKYGTRGSFNILNQNNSAKKIVITHRIDFGIDELAKTLLKAIYLLQTKKRAEVGEIPFYERQKSVNYLFQNSRLSNIFPKSKMNTNQYVSEKLIKDSKLFLAKLGFPHELPFQIKNDKIYLNKKNVDALFTQQEKDLLSSLIMKDGELISFDEVSEIIWKEDSFEKFSLFSLAKIVENLRRKFRQLGLNGEVIKTIRNRGYILNG